MLHHSHQIVLGLLCVSISAGFAPAADRDKLSLDGTWSFATDPNNRGETEKWYSANVKLPAMPLPGYAPTANGTIQVPGIWDNQGYGVETEKTRHNFVGCGWYRRQVEIPQSWSGRRAFLVITGVSRYSKVWVNKHYLGEQVGYLSTQQYDVTPYVVPGKAATIAIQVDSKQRWEVDSMFGGSSMADYMDVAWGGIWGHVFLEARPDTWLSDPYIQSDVANSSCTVSVTCNGKVEAADTAKLEILDKNGRHIAEATTKLDAKLAAGQPVNIKALVPNAALWTPDSPTLYTAKISLMKGERTLDTIENRFGMRQFSIDGPYLLLNGRRMMLRGYGDGHVYAEQMAMPSDKELHLKRLRIIKSYGFNHVRNHSTIMPPEYYDACDEVGIITSAEFPIVYDRFLPGTGDIWKSRVAPGTTPAAAIDTYKREWAASVIQHRNHPSILCWVMGNELWDGIPLRYEFQRIAKTNDPSRFFVDSDGVWGFDLLGPNSSILENKKDRDTLDLYFVLFNCFTNALDNPTKFKTPKPIKPVISHESGNYCTFARPDLVDQFRHNIKPFWLTAGREKLQKLGLLDEASQWAEKSERLYLLLHKHNLETLRKNAFLSGYHWWLFQDYWTSSNGIVDQYFRPKAITPEEVRQFNGPVVLLQEGLDRTYRGKARLQLSLLVSNFSPETLGGTLSYNITAGTKSIVQKHVPLKDVPQGELSTAETIAVQLPDVKTAETLRITATLEAGGSRFDNQWTSRLYPADIAPQKLPVPIFADEPQQKRFAAWNLKPTPLGSNLPSEAVYLASWIDERLIDAMNRGASVIMLEGARRFLKSYPMTFRTSWWKAGDKREENRTGTFVYDHPAIKDMAPDGWCDDGWFHLINGGMKFDLEKAPCRPNVLVRALNSMVSPADEALLFEVGIGRGRLIISGLNHVAAVDRPENQWLVARLIDHAARSPKPKASWPSSFLTAISIAPEGSFSGFRQLVANEGENGISYSYSEDAAKLFVCRQTQPGNAVTWKTAPLPSDFSADQATFVFAGTLGYASQPKTAGFALDLGGKEVLRFDLPEPKTWQSVDKRVQLRFESVRTVTSDQMGTFHLTVPRDMLKPGEPCILTVRSLGEGSRRWFGLTPYF